MKSGKWQAHNKVTSGVLACFVFLSFITCHVSTAFAVDTAAKQAFLIDAQTHAVLLNKEGDAQMHPSSMSKLMTIYLLFSRLKEGRVKLDDRFAISEKAWRTQGSKTFVHVGDTISVEDLIHGIIIQSGNDACIVVAEGLSGSEEEYVAEMNKTAEKMGLKQSHFVNSTGLPDDAHLMSARDLATLSQRLIEDFPEYYHYFALREYTYNNITQHNRNRLLDRDIGVDGLKTGHTDAAGFGIALSAKQNDRRLILVINGLESDNKRVEEGDKLLRWGFREFTNKPIAVKGQKIAEASVWLGAKENVALTVRNDLLLTLPASMPENISFTLKYNGPVPAPIIAGDHVADLVVAVPGSDAQTIALVAAENVEKISPWRKIFALLHYYIFGLGESK